MTGDRSDQSPVVAYFSMEIAIDDAIPTYSGGLGVLAGDHLRAAADLGISVIAVTLVYHGGYFHQQVGSAGIQRERAEKWAPEELLERVDEQVDVLIEGRSVRVGAWRRLIPGQAGHSVPVYFLDTRLPGNSPRDQAITDRLYGGDAALRLRQEIVLGIGGVALLARLGYDGIGTFHMNEGHSSLLTLALMERVSGLPDAPRPGPTSGPGRAAPDVRLDGGAVEAVRSRCVFTTHTPVAAGHDRFDRGLLNHILGPVRTTRLEELGYLAGGELNMTVLGISMSRFVNAVSQLHRSVSQAMFPDATIHSITNGVHAATWTAPSVQRLFDRWSPAWRRDNAGLRYATAIPLADIRAAHAESKRTMIEAVSDRIGVLLDPEVLTLGVARRATAYKRNDLVLFSPERLRSLVERVGPLQIVFGGKAHPNDEGGKASIERIVRAAERLRGHVTVVFVEGYAMRLASLLCAGVDVWCNTPVRLHEASGTSGMKAALNGVPSLSVLDGWWAEGHWEGVTGWSIGTPPIPVERRDDGGPTKRHDDGGPTEPKGAPITESGVHVEGVDPALAAAEAALLYDKLEQVVAPLYYEDPDGFAEVMRNAIALNGAFFNTERMVREYALLAYDAQP